MSHGHHDAALDTLSRQFSILRWRDVCQTGGIMRFWLPAVLIFLAGAPSYAAPDEQDQPDPSSGSRRNPDFLFGRPSGTFGVRGSWVFNRAGSDWYDFVTDQLTIDDGAFNAPGVTLEVGFLLKPQLDVVAGVD